LRWWAPLIAVALGACAGLSEGPSPEARAAAEAAANVYPTYHKPEILAFLRTYLNDPAGVHDAMISAPAIKPVGSGNRYVVCVRFNAKRTSGGYAGGKDHLVTFFGGKLDRFLEATRDQCRDAPYEPFPELERLAR